MPLGGGADLLSKFRKDKVKEDGAAGKPVADVRYFLLSNYYVDCFEYCSLLDSSLNSRKFLVVSFENFACLHFQT